jgi:hypothetical protein
MKKINLFFLCISFIVVLSNLIVGQNIQVHEMIGKKLNEVVKKYGDPIHKDNSNPSMLCMYYKTNISSMIFVADESGVYQAEATKIFDTENGVRKEIDLFISKSIESAFSVDTVTTSDFHLHKKGTKVDLQMSENKLTKKFDIRVKANRVED